MHICLNVTLMEFVLSLDYIILVLLMAHKVVTRIQSKENTNYSVTNFTNYSNKSQLFILFHLYI